METADIIRKLCKERSLSVTKLEEELGFSNGSLLKGAAIRSDRLYILAKRLGVSMEYLLTGEEPATAPAPARAAAVADMVPILSDSGFGLSAEEMALLKGFRVASGPVRKIMLDAARDALKGEGGERFADSSGDVGA